MFVGETRSIYLKMLALAALGACTTGFGFVEHPCKTFVHRESQTFLPPENPVNTQMNNCGGNEREHTTLTPQEAQAYLERQMYEYGLIPYPPTTMAHHNKTTPTDRDDNPLCQHSFVCTRPTSHVVDVDTATGKKFRRVYHLCFGKCLKCGKIEIWDRSLSWGYKSSHKDDSWGILRPSKE